MGNIFYAMKNDDISLFSAQIMDSFVIASISRLTFWVYAVTSACQLWAPSAHRDATTRWDHHCSFLDCLSCPPGLTDAPMAWMHAGTDPIPECRGNLGNNLQPGNANQFKLKGDYSLAL